MGDVIGAPPNPRASAPAARRPALLVAGHAAAAASMPLGGRGSRQSWMRRFAAPCPVTRASVARPAARHAQRVG